MESVFETLLTLIPLALILALRIAASRKERQRVQDQTKVIEVLKTKAAKPAKAIHQKQEYKPAFKFEESAHPPIARWEDIPQAKKAAVSSAPEMVAPDIPSMPESPPMKEVLPATAIHEKVMNDGKGFPFQRLVKLSQLQQAVVYAELLGPPKGMQP